MHSRGADSEDRGIPELLSRCRDHVPRDSLRYSTAGGGEHARLENHSGDNVCGQRRNHFSVCRWIDGDGKEKKRKKKKRGMRNGSINERRNDHGRKRVIRCV